MRRPVTTLLLVAVVAPALAGDGRLEISQACAATGCFAGDASGFPVSITTAGGYVLTGNLALAGSVVDGIEVTASGVTIDMGGMAIVGPATCTGTGAGVTCNLARSFAQSGISIAASDVSVYNGTISGTTENAVGITTAVTGVRIERIRAVRNAGNGISMQPTIAGNTSIAIVDSQVVAHGRDELARDRSQRVVAEHLHRAVVGLERGAPRPSYRSACRSSTPT